MSHMLIKISTCDVFLSALQLAKSPFWGSKPLVYVWAIWRAQDLSLSDVPLLSKLLTGEAFLTNPFLIFWALTIKLPQAF